MMRSRILNIACLLTLFHFTEAQVSLRLLINYSNTDTIVAGDPVTLQLQVYNADAEYAVIYNDAVRENLAKLEKEYSEGVWTQEDYDAEKSYLENSIKPQVPVSIPGEFLRSGLRILFDHKPMANVDALRCSGMPEARDYSIGSDGRLRMMFGIGPDITGQWSAGHHTLQLTLDTLSTDSIPCFVIPADQDRSLKLVKLVTLGYFYLDCDDPNQSMTTVDEVLKSEPEYLDAVTLKGDVYQALQDTTQALIWYENALKLFHLQYPDSFEDPEYLLNRMRALRKEE